ncbi:MAG: FHA domain-containing protein [Clostridiales bacterium]|nr:FHA domain-containing protein [Clostridiales bacterium]
MYDIKASQRVDLSGAYLVIALKGTPLITYQEDMLKENKLNGYLDVNSKYERGGYNIYYKINDYKPLSKALQKYLPLSDFWKIVDSILDAMIDRDKYFLSENSLILHQDYIFMRNTSDIKFVYLPTKIMEDANDTLKKLISWLLEKLDIRFLSVASPVEETLNKTYIAPMQLKDEIKKLRENFVDNTTLLSQMVVETLAERQEQDIVSPTEKDTLSSKNTAPSFKKNSYIYTENNTSSHSRYNTFSGTDEFTIPPAGKNVFVPDERNTSASIKNQSIFSILSSRSQNENSPETKSNSPAVDLTTAVDTEIRDATTAPLYKKSPSETQPAQHYYTAPPQTPQSDPPQTAQPIDVTPLTSPTQLKSKNAVLIPKNAANTTSVCIDKPSFTVGWLEHSDLVIFEFGIDRSHAEFTFDGVNLRLIDKNSKAGTYVNGDRLKANAPTTIKDGDIIAFYNSEYTLKISDRND